LLAYFAGRIRRRLAFRAVVKQFDDEIAIGERPHVIAHSFGTFLCGRLMQRPTTHCSRVIFAGSVLARDFPASNLPGKDERPFEEMRNEVGKRDLVVRLAGAVRRLVPNLGDAGVRGFLQDGVHVHFVADADSECDECRSARERPRWCIHNVQLDYYTHDDAFISPKHALTFWLPFLWEIESKEFREWLELCGVAARTEAPGRLGKAALEAEVRLLARIWKWAGGTLEQFVRTEYATATSSLDDPLEALRFWRALWKVVDQASRLSVNHGEDPTLMAHARALEPRVAIQVALGLLVPK
jgi:pimeloyl-ACP methyl ester carboxylesterase